MPSFSSSFLPLLSLRRIPFLPPSFPIPSYSPSPLLSTLSPLSSLQSDSPEWVRASVAGGGGGGRVQPAAMQSVQNETQTEEEERRGGKSAAAVKTPLSFLSLSPSPPRLPSEHQKLSPLLMGTTRACVWVGREKNIQSLHKNCEEVLCV